MDVPISLLQKMNARFYGISVIGVALSFIRLAIRDAHAHIQLMLNEIDRGGDIDIDAWALDRWSGEVGATRSLKLRAEERPVGVLPLQCWVPDVLYDLWRFSCEMPDAPHLRHKPVARSAAKASY
jgi:hypothetical protein